MKISNIAVAFALALAACGADDHDDLDQVVWSATTPPGTQAEVDDQGTLVFSMGGPGYCPTPPCGALSIATELPAGDFHLVFEDVVLENAGEVGAHVAVGDYSVTTRFNRMGDGTQGIVIEAIGESQYEVDGAMTPGDQPVSSEFALTREGDRLTGSASSTTFEVTQFADVGSGPAQLLLYLEANEVASPSDALGAVIARRSVGGEVTTFDGDVIEPE